MRILCVGDLHLRDLPPSSCTESYVDDLFELINQIRIVAEKQSVDSVVLAGDVFDIKTPSRNSHRLVQRTIDAFRAFPCEVFVVPGNHDMLYDRFSSVFETQPLGVVIRSGAMSLLSGWADSHTFRGKRVTYTEDYDVQEFPIYGVPWLTEWDSPDESIRHQAVDESLSELRNRWDGSVPILVVTHAPFFPPTMESEYEFYHTKTFATQMVKDKGPASVYYGHIHEAHGVYVSGGVRFCNMGAIARSTLHQYNLTRSISVAMWDSETNKFKKITIPHKPASEIFKLEEKTKAGYQKLVLDGFISSIGTAKIETTTVESVLDHVGTLELEPDVVSVIAELLNSDG